jgi:hypothetical protein
MALHSGDVPAQTTRKAKGDWSGVFPDVRRFRMPNLRHFFAHQGQIRSVIAISIALVSGFGALAAWRATLTSDDASTMDSTYIQQVAQRGEEISKQEATVDEEVRIYALYRQHVEAAKQLSGEANQLRTSDSSLASSLDAQGQAELEVAHTLQGYFRAGAVDPSTNSYDRSTTLAYLESHDTKLQSLHPEAYLAMGEVLHRRVVLLVGLVAIFVAALFFLTLGQLSRAQLRPLFAGAGWAVAAAAVIVWPLVESGTFDRMFGS